VNEDPFWESSLRGAKFDGKHKLHINALANWSCPIYVYGMATYYWAVPNGIDPSWMYQFRLTVNEDGTEMRTYTDRFRLEAGRIRVPGSKHGTLDCPVATIVGVSIAAVLLLLGAIAGVCYWRKRQRHGYKIVSSEDAYIE
jgi:hypothetical protein